MLILVENLDYCQIALIIQVRNPERSMHLITNMCLIAVKEHWICSQTCHTNLLIVYSLYISISVYPTHSCIFRNCTPAFLSFALFKLHILQLYQSYFLIQESHYIGGSGGIRTHTAWRPRCRFGHLGPTRLETTSLCGFVDSRRTPAP